MLQRHSPSRDSCLRIPQPDESGCHSAPIHGGNVVGLQMELRRAANWLHVILKDRWSGRSSESETNLPTKSAILTILVKVWTSKLTIDLMLYRVLFVELSPFEVTEREMMKVDQRGLEMRFQFSTHTREGKRRGSLSTRSLHLLLVDDGDCHHSHSPPDYCSEVRRRPFSVVTSLRAARSAKGKARSRAE